MPLINQTIPGLYNGVSQQPPTLRLDTQCELQENAYSSLVDGLIKRPPTEYIAGLTSNASLTSFIHPIIRDAVERYLAVFTGNAAEPIEIYDLSGFKKTVRYGKLYEDASHGGVQIGNFWFVADDTIKDYTLSGITNPRAELRATTIADYTIVVNTKKLAAMSSVVDLPQTPKAIVYVKRGVAATDYTVKVDDVVKAEYSSSDSAQPDTYKTNAIVDHLYTDLQSNLGTGWTVQKLGASVVFWRNDGADFMLKVSDSYGNQALVGVKNSVQKFTDLPPEAPDGYVVTIEGDEVSQFDDYYVKFRADAEHSPGVWQESVRPGLRNHFDALTLPHRLVRLSDGTFCLAPIDWAPRTIGDDVGSAPEPSFIGSTISDVFFFKNRLGFLTGENVVLSRVGEFFNFWPSTALDVLDSDPIDVAASTNQVSILKYAVPFATNMVLFSDQQQFIFASGENLLTPKTVAIDLSTRFEVAPCKPVGAGSNVYFVSPNGDFSSIREYFVQTDTMQNDAANITSHVPRYLPKNLSLLVASIAMDTLFALSDDEPKALYVYKYYWNNDEKLQSSWSKWTFDEDILSLCAIENYLFLLMKGSSGAYLAKMNLEKVVSGSLPFRVHLDKQVCKRGVYDPNTNETLWDLGYIDDASTFVVVDAATGNQVLNITQPVNGIIKAVGQYDAADVYLGKSYTMRFRFSQWYVKSQEEAVANVQGRLQIRTLTLAFTRTGYFRLEITPFRREVIVHRYNTGYSYMEQVPPSGEPITDEYAGVVVGVSTIGTPSLISDEHKFLIMSQSTSQIDLVNDSFLPSEFQSASYEGFFVVRSRAV